MWNFNEQIKTNDIEEICAILNLYKDKWIIAGEYYHRYLKVKKTTPKTDKQFEFIGAYKLDGELLYATKKIPLWLDNWYEDTEYKVLIELESQ